MRRGLVLGLSGAIASGKTTLAEKLAEKDGFIHLRSRNVLVEMLTNKNFEVSEKNLQDIGKEVIESIGGSGLSALVLKNYNHSNNYLYDSIRHVKDLDYFKQRFGDSFRLIFIDCSEEVRKDRYLKRKNRDCTMESFKERTKHIIEEEIPMLKKESDQIFLNEDDNILEEVNIFIKNWEEKLK